MPGNEIVWNWRAKTSGGNVLPDDGMKHCWLEPILDLPSRGRDLAGKSESTVSALVRALAFPRTILEKPGGRRTTVQLLRSRVVERTKVRRDNTNQRCVVAPP